MSERKVLNKYYPPDFDPSKIPRLRLPKDRQYTVRLMAPCNMRCKTCGEYIYKGKKFNARKETVQNEEYLGIKIFRFYIKCPRCLAEITFKTDPENADYVVEHGATRNFQALKLAEEQAEKEAKEVEEEEKNNPMKLLENRTKASKQEMELLESLAELKELNQRHAVVDFEKLLQQNQLQLLDKIKKQEDEDEAFIRSVFGKTISGESVKRIRDDSDDDDDEKSHSPGLKLNNGKSATDILCDESKKHVNQQKKLKTGSTSSLKSIAAGIVKVRKRQPDASSSTSIDVSNKSDSVSEKSTVQSSSQNALSFLSVYSDSEPTSGED